MGVEAHHLTIYGVIEMETVEVNKESVEALADNIEKLTSSMQSLLDSGLKEETIVLLLHDHSGVGKRQIKQVLESLVSLGYYLED